MSARCLILFASLGLVGFLTTIAAATTPTYLGQWGSYGIGDGQFFGPAGAAVDRFGNVYVADRLNHRIQKFAGDGLYLAQWGSQGSGEGQFEDVACVAVDPAGNVYVGDGMNCCVQKFSGEGVFLAQWGEFGYGGQGQFCGMGGIAVDDSGHVFVTNPYPAAIQKFTNTGTFLQEWGSPLGFEGIGALAVSAGGNVYVAEGSDFSTNRIQEFTSTGEYITNWGSYGTGDGQFRIIRGVATDGMGRVYVLDEALCRVQMFTGEGVYLDQWGSQGTGDMQFDFPAGMAIGATGRVYISEGLGDCVKMYQLHVTGVPGTVSALRLYPNQPNPFNARTDLRFDLLATGRVRLEVYDVGGRFVRCLVDADLPVGAHGAVWDARDEAGRALASGSYLARLVAGGKVETVRMSLIR